ncbi:hypothetical protein [Stenotrophomonas sp. GD03657]|uniref:hypothetical protein n=1 Tax=Stenotrophomonas sp. GD03657 TaxID=2975363 RepID=UPI0024497612|nr:hypothetical protein [Stenotrophomonas sp. GD03657]MDH2154349.1 hypothetical protein [Stenotrophomonas sp. GD03657]
MSIESQQILNNALNPEDPVDSRIVAMLNQLEAYNDAMKPGAPISSEEGARWQKRLFNIFMDCLRQKDEAFVRTWDALLQYVHRKHDESFKMPLPSRFPEYIALTKDEARNFHRLVYLIVRTANPKTRALHLTQIHLDTVLQGLRGSQADSLRDFYHVG